MPVTKAIISSTILDLPEHRVGVAEACLRQSIFPLMMEYMPASGRDAIRESMRLVDEADLYLGIFAHRYGYVPHGHELSITEMEYRRAVEREIPCLIFLIHPDHLLKAEDIETGSGAARIEKLKKCLARDHVVNKFKNPDDLRALVINALSRVRSPDPTRFHPITDIPSPPDAYIAHPYTLLQTREVVGRQEQLNLLTSWVSNPESDLYSTRVLNIIAIGGMGKSALTWKWFNSIAPHEIPNLQGRIWWSFYESDAGYENFVTRALAYILGLPLEELRKTKHAEREQRLLESLNQSTFLLVLDGLERIMLAYARMDAATMPDHDLDEKAANVVSDGRGLFEYQAFKAKHTLRKMIDPRAGLFLRRLCQMQQSRVLVSTRLYPAELQNDVGKEIAGSKAVFLNGLKDDDALNLWREFDVSGTRQELLSLFHSFENYPLLIRALAGEVASFRPAPGDFSKWKEAHPEFNPFELPLIQRKSHVLAYAMRGIGRRERRTLLTISAFRMPASYDALTAILCGDGQGFTEEQLDRSLTDLEDRGVIGWDRRSNRYDLHPIVRAITWNALGDVGKKIIYKSLQAHFEALPAVSEENVNSVDDLTPAIELFNTLVGLGLHEKAIEIFLTFIDEPTLFKFNASRQRIELLEMLIDQENLMARDFKVHSRLVFTDLPHMLGYSYLFAGLPQEAEKLFLKTFRRRKKDVVVICNIANARRLIGRLHGARRACEAALSYRSSSFALTFLGWVLGATNQIQAASETWGKALEIMKAAEGETEHIARTLAYQSQLRSRMGDFEEASRLARESLDMALECGYARDIIRAYRAEGYAALGSAELDGVELADQKFHTALEMARTDLVDEEILILIGLAKVRVRQEKLQAARVFLEQMWELADRGPYPLYKADALNVQSEIESLEGNQDAAIKAALEAYRLSWCDGPPYAYHWGLEASKSLLRSLKFDQLPEMPPFKPKTEDLIP